MLCGESAGIARGHPSGQVVAYIEHGGALDVARAADGCARADRHSMHMRAEMQRTP